MVWIFVGRISSARLGASSKPIGIKCKVMPGHAHGLVGVDSHFGIHRWVRLGEERSSCLRRQKSPELRSHLPTLTYGLDMARP